MTYRLVPRFPADATLTAPAGLLCYRQESAFPTSELLANTPIYDHAGKNSAKDR